MNLSVMNTFTHHKECLYSLSNHLNRVEKVFFVQRIVNTAQVKKEENASFPLMMNFQKSKEYQELHLTAAQEMGISIKQNTKQSK